MILALSSSSPRLSVATFTDDGELVGERSVMAPREAAVRVMQLVDEIATPHDMTGVVADVGPGSFTGVKVGVMVAKAMAMELGIRCGAVSVFDLMPAGAFVCTRSDLYLSRNAELPTPPEGAIGYGAAFAEQTRPNAANLKIGDVEWTNPLLLLPDYRAKPAIQMS